MNQPQKRICIGKIATAHGVRGLVKILIFAEDPALLGGVLYLGETGDSTINVTPKNAMGKYWLAAIENITDRNQADLLRGKTLWIDRAALPDTEGEDDFYIEDLIGLTAETASGDRIGSVIAVDNFGAGDLLEIKPDIGDSFYISFTKANVPEIVLNQNKVIISGIPDE